MKAKLRRMPKVDLVIIDYLGLMASTKKTDNQVQIIGDITQNLKNMAKELNVPIICAAQLNRGGEGPDKKSRRPSLSSLRDSGSIEQDADIVCFIHRPEYYLRSDTDMEGRNIRGLAELIVAKHRSGRVDDVKMRFRKEFARFENWEDGPMVSAVSVGSKMNASGDDGGMSSSAGATFSGGSADFLGATDEPTPF